MQTYEKKIDTRPLKEIYLTFSQQEQRYFKSELEKKKIPPQSFYRWLRGTKPSGVYRDTIRAVLRDKMNIKTFEDTLFPQEGK